MEIPPELLEKLLVLGRKLTARRIRLCAVLRYDPLAGAVYWSDELPKRLDAEEQNIIRAILRYRTTLILGASDEELEPYWEAGQHCFPGWIGFSAVRVAPNPSVVDFYKDQSERWFQQYLKEADDEE
jgi:hypothetical protein